MRTERTRMTDKFPLTDKLTWRFLRAAYRIQSIKPIDALCFIGAGIVYGGGFWVVAQWMFGA